ncbi:MAG TPA: GPR1/FUN34/YaaH family transporter [Bryobacteraceae bacterium]|jgi:hypothetical protein|nr:GPR1/FUN34/YaaH family transporter [Bryobacteraceae bacterium]
MADEIVSTEASPHILLQPIAAPSILGLYGFAGATFIVAAHMAGWYGGGRTELYLFPFAALFGGLAQFLAGMWAYHARDGLATAMHGMWGAFWMAYGILNLLFATGTLIKPDGAFPAFGYWFIPLAAITGAGMWAASSENRALTAVLAFLAFGSTLAAIGLIGGYNDVVTAAGWLFIISALCAYYTATALMLRASTGRSVLPLGKTAQSRLTPTIAPGIGEPGVIHGQ